VNVRLLQLASPSLPVGAYSYSQGLEAAIEAGVVRDEASAASWIRGVLEISLASMEAPVFLRLAAAWRTRDVQALRRWNEEWIVSRETAELRAETLQMGHSLRELLKSLGLPDAAQLDAFREIAFPTAYTFATTSWDIEAREALAAYLFAWIENQILAAVKTVPLGQTAGQRMLLALGERIGPIVAAAVELGDDDLANFAPGLAILSACHETQYSRMFRS
jgi:urease accessory protein